MSVMTLLGLVVTALLLVGSRSESTRCQIPVDHADAHADTVRWYWNSTRHSCSLFTPLQLSVNTTANDFASYTECTATCGL